MLTRAEHVHKPSHDITAPHGNASVSRTLRGWAAPPSYGNNENNQKTIAHVVGSVADEGRHADERGGADLGLIDSATILFIFSFERVRRGEVDCSTMTRGIHTTLVHRTTSAPLPGGHIRCMRSKFMAVPSRIITQQLTEALPPEM